jgi:hypothetical protein
VAQLESEHRLLLNLPLEYTHSTWLEDKDHLLAEVNWNVVFHLSKLHRLLPLTYTALGCYMPNRYRDKFAKEYAKNQLKVEACLDEMEAVAAECRKEGVELLLRKGPAFSFMIYKDMFLRHFNDIDMLIQESDMHAIHRALSKLQWRHGYYMGLHGGFQLLEHPTLKDTGSNEYHHYRKETAAGMLHLDLGRSIKTLSPVQARRFFANTIPLRNYSIRCANAEYGFAELCLNAHHNASSWDSRLKHEINLRDFIDFFLFIRNCSKDMNWDHTLHILDELNARPALEHMVKALLVLYGDFVDEEQQIALLGRSCTEPAGEEEREELLHRIFFRTGQSGNYVQACKQELQAHENHAKRIPREGEAGELNPSQVAANPFPAMGGGITYKLHNSGGDLMITVHIPSSVFEQLRDYVLEWRILNHNQEEDCFFQLIYLSECDGTVGYGVYDSLDYFHTNDRLKDGMYFNMGPFIPAGEPEIGMDTVCITIKVPIETGRLRNGIFGLQASLFYRIAGTLYHTVLSFSGPVHAASVSVYSM